MSQLLQVLVHQSSSYSTQTLLLLCSLLFLVERLLINKTTASNKNTNLPPSPPKLPLIGNMHQVGALPHVSLRALSEKHGPVIFLQLGQLPCVVASSPEASQEILRTHDLNFASRPRSELAHIITYGSRDVGFAPYGEAWRQGKKVITTHLLTAKKVQDFGLAREEEARLVIDKVRTSLHRVADVSEILNSFANDIICRAVAGKRFRAEGKSEQFGKLIELTAELLGGFDLADYFPKLAWMNVFSHLLTTKAKKVNRKWDEVLEKVIKDHEIGEDDGDDRESDFVDVLLSVQKEVPVLTRDHVKAILVDMFDAGTETSYLTLEYAMAELMLNERVMRRLEDEVRQTVPKGQEMVREADLNDMSYLKAVIKETLRLHPPAPLLVPRECREDSKIQGYNIPKGTRVIINCYAICRDPKYWDAPDEFKPERHMKVDGNNNDNNLVDFWGKDFKFTPFGAGRRICPGINFSMYTVELMLANLMYHFDWQLPSSVVKLDMSEHFGLTVHRKEKLLLVPKPSSSTS